MKERMPLKQTIAVRVVTDMGFGPARSVFLRFGNKVTHGKIFAEYNQQPKPPLKETLTLGQTSQVLADVFKKLDDTEKGGLKSLYDNWSSVRSKLQAVIGENHVITDYVSFDPQHQRFILFLKTKNASKSAPAPYTLTSLVVPAGTVSVESLQEQIRNHCASVDLQNNTDWATTENRLLPETDELIEMEKSIGLIHHQLEVDESQTVTHRISQSANTHELRKNRKFDRDGTILTGVRELPVYTLGELQELQRYLFAHGIRFNAKEGDVEINTDLAEQWFAMRKLGNVEKDQAEAEMKQYARETTYFSFINHYFKHCPQEVYDFMNSATFRNHEAQFKNVYFAARAQTEFAVARAMLANFFLMHFEGTQDMKESVSQYGLARDPSYQPEVDTYIRSRRSLEQLLPKVASPEQDQSDALNQMYTVLEPKPIPPEFDAEKIQVVSMKAEAALKKIDYEVRRQEQGDRIWKRVKEKAHLIEHPRRKARIFPRLISNFGMARAPGDIHTAADWQDGGEFLTEGSKLVPFEKSDKETPIEDSIRHIFNAQVLKIDGEIQDKQSKNAYKSQVKRIHEEGANILHFLQTDPRIPQNVKEFMATLTTDEVAFRIMERFGPISDQDPNVVNRFYENFEDFRTSLLHRYVTDFVRGVETKLIEMTQPVGEKFARTTLGRWKNYDFSNVPDDKLRLAITYTLAHGEHRIKRLNHETSEVITLKDVQETLEKWIGTDTYDLKYLRYDELMDIWNTLGGAWDCICFSRKTLFNPETMQQF